MREPGCFSGSAGLPLKDLRGPVLSCQRALFLSPLSKDDYLTGFAGVVAPSLACWPGGKTLVAGFTLAPFHRVMPPGHLTQVNIRAVHYLERICDLSPGGFRSSGRNPQGFYVGSCNGFCLTCMYVPG
jgi:hypothetical protein